MLSAEPNSTDSLAPGRPLEGVAEALSFEQVYRENLVFVWRNAQRIGVLRSSLDDVVQEVFVVVHRRLAEFEGRSTIRTWLYAILRNVALEHWKRQRREEPTMADLPDVPDSSRTPGKELERHQAGELVLKILSGLDQDKLDVFLLAELEQLPMPEIAKTLDINENTGYARLRAARKEVSDAAARYRSSEQFSAPQALSARRIG
jgi:RNA polymerase sigma-70 factor, ECF subfamily